VLLGDVLDKCVVLCRRKRNDLQESEAKHDDNAGIDGSWLEKFFGSIAILPWQTY
jgi:hypothetical protein